MRTIFHPFFKASPSEQGSIVQITDDTNLPPPIGITPPQILAQQAAEGQRGAAWRLLQLLSEDNAYASAALISSNDDRLTKYLLEFIALGTWAGKPFVVPQRLRSPYTRMRLRIYFRPHGYADPTHMENML